MHDDLFNNPALTVALAMVMGVIAQVIARHLKLPGIVLLLAAGVALGPDGADVVRPSTLGQGLSTLVGFAVAVILFEGGLQLRMRALQAEAKPIRRLVTVGACVTGVGASLVALPVFSYDLRLSILFGTLVIVTGPTVINPLLRRIRLKHSLATILEAEGIFIDAVGATIAVVALEVALGPSVQSFGLGALGIVGRLGVGALIGLTGGGLLALLLHWKHVVPFGLENILSLGFSIAIFQISNSLVHESGIAAAIVAGVVVGNVRTHAFEQLAAFKEQLTTIFIATLFVLLSADIRLSEVAELGRGGVLATVALMVVVRPASVLLSTIGTDLKLREKLFLCWLAPRGIVAAAVASLFATELALAGIEGGRQLRAMVFLVIAITVSVQGLSGGLIAGILKVRKPRPNGYLILGANAVSRRLTSILVRSGQRVTVVDPSAAACETMEGLGAQLECINALDPHELRRLDPSDYLSCVAVSHNESVNFLFAHTLRRLAPEVPIYIALESASEGVTRSMVDEIDGQVLFGRASQIRRWSQMIRDGEPLSARYRYEGKQRRLRFDVRNAPARSLIALLGARKKKAFLIGDMPKIRRGDELEFLLDPELETEARHWLESSNWKLVPAAATPPNSRATPS
ncbi:MAG: sodium:proton antiporter [Nannocystaceae bacterium]